MTSTKVRPAVDREALERRTREVGRELFARVGRGPAFWEREWWDDRLMNFTLGDPEVRVQLFRFIDVIPSLRDDSSARRHLQEYLAEAGDRVPWWLSLAVALAPPGRLGARALAGFARFASAH